MVTIYSGDAWQPHWSFPALCRCATTFASSSWPKTNLLAFHRFAYFSAILFARIIRFSRTKMTDERGAGVRRRAGKGQCNGSGRRCLGLSLDLGLDLSTFAIVPEAIPYWLWGGRASEHITWLNRPNGIATGLAALTLLKYPPPSPRPFNKTFTRGPPNYSDTYRPLYRRETTPPTTVFPIVYLIRDLQICCNQEKRNSKDWFRMLRYIYNGEV